MQFFTTTRVFTSHRHSILKEKNLLLQSCERTTSHSNHTSLEYFAIYIIYIYMCVCVCVCVCVHDWIYENQPYGDM